jgi:hypothetical protein
MNSSNQIDRRTLLTAAPALGIAAAASGVRGAVAEENDSHQSILRIGCLNVKSYSHLASHWASIINPPNDEVRLTGMRITHCWDIDAEGAKGFANSYECVAVPHFDDMLGKVDGIINGGYYNHGWNHILHEPYLEAGLPNLINRPLANSLAKARKMVETARKSGATILVPSAFEHNNEIAGAKSWATGKKLVSYHATNGADDYPTHGIHGVYMVFRTIVEAHNPVVSVGYRAKSWHRPPGIMTIEHRDNEGRQFFGTIDQTGGWGAIRIRADSEPPRSFAIVPGNGYPFNKTQVWAPTLWAFEHMARRRQMPQSLDQILDKNNIFLAGWRSILENDGNPVKLDQVPVDWETPVKLPNRPSDTTASLFEKEFG